MTAKAMCVEMSGTRTRLIAALFALPLLLAGAETGRADDTDLFRSSVPPNVMIVVDNSKSMNQSVTHPGFSGTIAGVLNKDQTNCQAFRDHGKQFTIYYAGQGKAI